MMGFGHSLLLGAASKQKEERLQTMQTLNLLFFWIGSFLRAGRLGGLMR
jgi:hypothetical protein